MSQQYPQYGAPGSQDGHGNTPQPQAVNYENYETQSPPGVAPGPPAGPAQTGRKKRAYAGQAYEFGAGGNAALGGQQQGGGAAPYSGYSQQADAAGYPQGGYQQQPAAVQQSATPMYGHQDGAAAPGGYQPPGPQYPVQAQASPALGGMTQQFGQMNMSEKPPAAGQTRPPVLNQLYPTDLSNQPFNVAELDYPPPPAILPANVSRQH